MSEPTELRDRIRDEVSGIQIGTGYYAQTIGIDGGREVADAILPIVEAELEAVKADRQEIHRKGAAFHARAIHAEAEHRELAAVIERAKALCEPPWDGDGHQGAAMLLGSAPTDALREHDASVWEEGRASAFADMMRPLRDDMTRESTPNPYREQEDV